MTRVKPKPWPELAAAIARRNVTYGEVGAALGGVAASTIAGIVRGTTTPSAAMKVRLAAYFDTSVEALFAPRPEVQALVERAITGGLPAEVVGDPRVLRQLGAVAERPDGGGAS